SYQNLRQLRVDCEAYKRIMSEAMSSRRIETAITIGFALLYVSLAWFIAVLGSVHGPQVFPYFVIGYLCVVEVALGWLYFYIRKHMSKHKTLRLLAGACGLGITLGAAAFATWSPLVDWEVTQMERRAAATLVFNVHDEILLSEKGNPIGIRLRYSMQFPTSDYFWQSPTLTHQTDLSLETWADGRILDQEIEPLMTLDQSGVRRYERGKTYNFTMEFIPNFLMWNPRRTKVCILNPPAEYQTAFESLLRNGVRVPYRVRISGTKFEGLTDNPYQ